MGASSKEYFETVASQWDEMRAEFFPASLRDRALDAAGALAGQSAADVGAGTGFLTEALVERGLRVVAVDQSPAMLTILQQKHGKTGSLECREGASERLPLEDGSMDHVFANMYLHHVEDPGGAIAEMARSLKPGGSLVVTDVDSHEHEFLRTEHHDRWMGFEREQVRAWFEAAGLVDVFVECADARCSATSSGGEETDISIFLAKGIRKDTSLR